MKLKDKIINTISFIPLYKNGDITKITGAKIKQIIYRDKKIIVFLNEGGEVSHEYAGISPYNFSAVLSKMFELSTLISLKELPEPLGKCLRLDLGIALYGALIQNSEKNGLEKFKSIEEKINSIRASEETKIINAIFLILISSFFISIQLYLFRCEILATSLNNIILCSSAGCFGSLLSVIHRNSKKKFNALFKKRYIIGNSIITALLGIFFGALIFIISHSNVALGFASENLYSLIVFSVIGGFSERFIPDLFKSLEEKQMGQIEVGPR